MLFIALDEYRHAEFVADAPNALDLVRARRGENRVNKMFALIIAFLHLVLGKGITDLREIQRFLSQPNTKSRFWLKKNLNFEPKIKIWG